MPFGDDIKVLVPEDSLAESPKGVAKRLSTSTSILALDLTADPR